MHHNLHSHVARLTPPPCENITPIICPPANGHTDPPICPDTQAPSDLTAWRSPSSHAAPSCPQPCSVLVGGGSGGGEEYQRGEASLGLQEVRNPRPAEAWEGSWVWVSWEELSCLITLTFVRHTFPGAIGPVPAWLPSHWISGV